MNPQLPTKEKTGLAWTILLLSACAFLSRPANARPHPDEAAAEAAATDGQSKLAENPEDAKPCADAASAPVDADSKGGKDADDKTAKALPCGKAAARGPVHAPGAAPAAEAPPTPETIAAHEVDAAKGVAAPTMKRANADALNFGANPPAAGANSESVGINLPAKGPLPNAPVMGGTASPYHSHIGAAVPPAPTQNAAAESERKPVRLAYWRRFFEDDGEAPPPPPPSN